jgi:hypothetical protein
MVLKRLENSLVVIALRGNQIKELISYFVKEKQHFSRFDLQLIKNKELKKYFNSRKSARK